MSEINTNYNVTAQGTYEKGDGYFKEVQEKISDRLRDDRGVSDTLLSNSAAALSISALSAEELEKTRQSWDNHPVSSLYRTELPISRNTDGVFMIGKVAFSEEEFTAARNFITDVGSQLKNGFLSYRDYAKMGMTESVVEKYATENFSEEQANVISRAMRDYNDSLIKKQDQMLENRDTIRTDDQDSGSYFGVKVSISEEARDLYHMRSDLRYAGTDVATNQELIEKLRENIKAFDITDKDEVERMKAFYQ